MSNSFARDSATGPPEPAPPRWCIIPSLSPGAIEARSRQLQRAFPPGFEAPQFVFDSKSPPCVAHPGGAPAAFAALRDFLATDRYKSLKAELAAHPPPLLTGVEHAALLCDALCFGSSAVGASELGRKAELLRLKGAAAALATTEPPPSSGSRPSHVFPAHTVPRTKAAARATASGALSASRAAVGLAGAVTAADASTLAAQTAIMALAADHEANEADHLVDQAFAESIGGEIVQPPDYVHACGETQQEFNCDVNVSYILSLHGGTVLDVADLQEALGHILAGTNDQTLAKLQTEAARVRWVVSCAPPLPAAEWGLNPPVPAPTPQERHIARLADCRSRCHAGAT